MTTDAAALVQLSEIVTDKQLSATEAAGTPGLEDFCAAAAELIGPEGVIRDPAALTKASCDWAHMSPILSAKLPAGQAEVVLRPSSHEQIPGLLALAHAHRIPVTPRGKGTGNYGQAIPLRGGAVLDLNGCNRILETGDGWIRAEAGAKMSDLELHARTLGWQLWMYPSTFGSTVGGFLSGGSGGAGSLSHGQNGEGFVRELTVVPCTATAEPFTVQGTDTLPYIHGYGTSGILATATVALEPAREWTALFSSFDDWAHATAALKELVWLEPAPRLASLDEAGLVAVLPPDEALDPEALSLRVVVETGAEQAAREIITRHGGHGLAVRPGPEGPALLGSLSFNHATYHLMNGQDGWFHLEIYGQGVLDNGLDELKKIFPGSLMHLEGMRENSLGLLMARYESEAAVYEGIDAVTALGLGVHDPHNWFVDRRVEMIREAARTTDPLGLLNPGKLLPPTTAS